jgi:hypothetical protein
MRSVASLLLLAINTVIGCLVIAGTTQAQNCPVNHDQLTKALKTSVKASGGPSNGGFDNNEWAVAVNRDGVVCAVTFSGNKPTDQWLPSRLIAEEKATAANGMSLDAMAISTANLYAGSLPGGYLYGLITTTPPIPGDLYAGDPKTYGSPSDPMSPDHNDGIIYDMLPDKTSASGYGHPQCGGHEADVAVEIHSGFVPKWAQVLVK